ncbi:CCA tRNA nucleotidyltransferase [Sphingosinicella soli]|uniref:Poly(A) polymerase n=1 Tax=Sphingosinicella soli TaxID=333708 RepID=A0A7W7AZD2_9SPHN|nr:CCA tRNA nucleotidyltransferase [Sphingosinicella soli]MBB4631153.1 poly(A) polymerase [Sphingosinicella soli]
MTRKLPPPAWSTTAGGAAVLRALDAENGTTRLVGGAVRDALLDLPVTDVDLATALSPAEVTKRLEAAGIQVVPTGIAHGTVTAVTPDLIIEVTTLRRDVSTDGRRATVKYTADWREDAARRDFTINALYARLPGGDIDDWFGGLLDLHEGRVRFIGEPLQRIAEDHLRILRFFRFHSRFGRGAPDAEGLAACAARANDLMALSRERIRDELFRILVLPRAAETLALMLALGILKPVLPEIVPECVPHLAALAGREAAWGVDPDPIRRFAALLPQREGLGAEFGARLRLSRRDTARLDALGVADPALPGDPFTAAYFRGVDVARDRLLLLGEDARAAWEALADWRKPAMPVSGKDIIARGISAGPEVSRRLQRFERDWVASGCPLDAARIDDLLAAALA